MARTEFFDLFFHPVFQKCLKHAESCATNEGMTWNNLTGHKSQYLCMIFVDVSICAQLSINYHFLDSLIYVFWVIISFPNH